MQIRKRLSVNRMRCPVCGKETKSWTDMGRHMATKGCYERTADYVGDDVHARYLDLLTGKDQSIWGHKNDAAVGNVMRRHYERLGGLPALTELEDVRGGHSGADVYGD